MLPLNEFEQLLTFGLQIDEPLLRDRDTRGNFSNPGFVSALAFYRSLFDEQLAPLASSTRPPPPGPQVGFAGIAKPWKVERSLKAAGCDLVDFVPFPDHAAYSNADMTFLTDRAAVFDARLVTTEKDWVRLTPEQRKAVVAWPVVARFEDEAAFAAFLNDRIQSAR